MKKMIAIILAIAAVLTMAACSAAPKATAPETTVPELTAPETTVPETTVPETTVPETTTPETTVSQNYFRNDTNFSMDSGNVAVKPRTVYYENGILVAECFVINGTEHTAFNISVDGLRFEDRNHDAISDGAFGMLNDLVLGPGQYVIWTFNFGGDAVCNLNADLSYLSCTYHTDYWY